MPLPHTRDSSRVAQQVLVGAAEIMEQRGLLKGDWGQVNQSGPVCLEGAIAQAGADLGLSADDLAIPMAIVEKTLGQRIPTWNDESVRTQEQAVELLHVCADVCEGAL